MADSKTITISVVNPMANGKITALRVQNQRTGIWSESTGASLTLEGQTGDLFYVGAWATNQGATGNLTLIISQQTPTAQEYTRKTENVAAGASFGAEWNMESGITGITIINVVVNP